MKLPTLDTTPVIIPFKEISERCPAKNFVLFPLVFSFLLKSGIKPENICVVSASQKVKSFVEPYGVKFAQESVSSINHDDIKASHQAAKQLDSEWYFMVPLTQPLRSRHIFNKLIANASDDISFVTTYVETHNRQIFEINSDSTFVVESEHHTGSMCPIVKVLDGSVYLMRRTFIDTLESSHDVNRDFWHSHFKAIAHESVICDIDTTEQLNSFLSVFDLL